MSTTPMPLPPEVAGWIGRRSERTDVISPRMAQSFQATLTPHLAPVPGAPLGIHWCLAPDLAPPPDLGPDGHPRPGLFLPALPYPRRMWAGGELSFQGTFAVGDVVTKTTTIADIAFKTGHSGRLAFVTIRHEYRVDAALILIERQDVVYRDAAGPGLRPSALAAEAASPARTWGLTTDPTLLFRYSALTFNGHRIHYDRPYAVEVEGYDGLVVHGPLQATLLLNLAAEVSGAVPGRFTYRGLAPLFCGLPLQVEADEPRGRERDLRVRNNEGVVTMSASAFPKE